MGLMIVPFLPGAAVTSASLVMRLARKNREHGYSPTPPKPPSRFRRWVLRCIDWCEHVIWLPIRAHLLALQCVWKRHAGVSFARHIDLWGGYWGDVYCDHCNVVFWVRHSTILMRLGQALCALRGHPEYDHPIMGMTNISSVLYDKFYCTRCMKSLDAQTAARLPRRLRDPEWYV